jgi:CO/xanthine dehydrogenase FAD-binding subunit
VTTTDLFIPRSVEEAVGLLREHGPDLTVMGGGTIVMGLVNDGLLIPRRAMSLRHAGSDGIRQAGGALVIGAAATLARLAALDAPTILAQAAAAVGGPAVRTMATVGGNLFAPPPAGDVAVALLALDAEVEIVGPHGARRMPLDRFFLGPGSTACAPGELVAAVHVPDAAGRAAYLRYGRRQANTPAVVAVAARVVVDGGAVREARIALGAAGPHPLRALAAEAALVGGALDAETFAAEGAVDAAACDPPTDALASAWYRRKMVGVYVRRALTQLAG